ncbi:hypothetical protein GGTG_02011 [Gaeumannomyces tritici R3-111a-1]|uniref:Secreted protein n=1 Tax=Gaeumannomyces tritici (strain R3-111a-1) TaxID=644352 RepID=J3NL70_GAET3|nr:hypothetical protein GGTG_02011 [Gaeumannomyces tritici R3-111a-1]EJT82037.1 hypothetical protein GGTG_02011 [Gaeumannomyces tritici R3-111a-1]
MAGPMQVPPYRQSVPLVFCVLCLSVCGRANGRGSGGRLQISAGRCWRPFTTQRLQSIPRAPR